MGKNQFISHSEWRWFTAIVFRLASEYSFSKDHEYLEGVEMNGTHKCLLYANNVNKLSENKYLADALLEASREVGGSKYRED